MRAHSFGKGPSKELLPSCRSRIAAQPSPYAGGSVDVRRLSLRFVFFVFTHMCVVLWKQRGHEGQGV